MAQTSKNKDRSLPQLHVEAAEGCDLFKALPFKRVTSQNQA
ncbi:hypothetical protein PMO01_15280 [Pseudomonas moraviensis R28-S]|uniref:Uncharacterized protein n=1 Tax=Pseudomonas moraviensis R28-S TaxID=1395516 RepID=V8R6S7_9PSED|nr:hypothetical protein PMO01_15280 [Pseudomonas moraviensis R28-S]